MFDADYFLRGLPDQVAELGGDAIVSVALHSGANFYVRDVVQTHEGYVMLNIWVGSSGRPIESPSSDAYSQEIPSGYHPAGVPFESIAMVYVIPTSIEHRRRIGFRRAARN